MNNPPKLEEVRIYVKQKKLNVDPDQFWNDFNSKSWKINGNKMKSWKLSIQAIHHKTTVKERPMINKPVMPVNREKELPVQERTEDKRFYPADKPLPTSIKTTKRYNPCPNCRRVLMDDLGQACIVTSSPKGIAFLRCKSCGHRWKMARKSEV